MSTRHYNQGDPDAPGQDDREAVPDDLDEQLDWRESAKERADEFKRERWEE